MRSLYEVGYEICLSHVRIEQLWVWQW